MALLLRGDDEEERRGRRTSGGGRKEANVVDVNVDVDVDDNVESIDASFVTGLKLHRIALVSLRRERHRSVQEALIVSELVEKASMGRTSWPRFFLVIKID